MGRKHWKQSLYLLTAGFVGLLPLAHPTVTAAPTAPAAEHETVEAGEEQFVRYTLQPGTVLHVVLQTPVHTGVNQPDDTVEAQIVQNVYLGRELILPRHTRFEGRIERLEPPLQGRDAVLGIRFDRILLENGETLPIRTHIQTGREDFLWGGGLTPGTKPRLVTHRVYGIGEYNQTVLSGPRAMGRHIEFSPGEHWVLVLDAPLTIVKKAD